MSNLQQRIISAVIIGIVTIISIFWYFPLFYTMMFFIATCMFYEWYKMTHTKLLYLLAGYLVITPPIVILIITSMIEPNRWVLFSYFVTIWSVDAFAMIGGKILKGPKLAPYLSPNKTWSGLMSGVIGSIIILIILNILTNLSISTYYKLHQFYLIPITGIIAIAAQSSDLLISFFKRKFGIKDSGKLIPGHGGILDRFDSIIFTAPIFLYILINYHI